MVRRFSRPPRDTAVLIATRNTGLLASLTAATAEARCEVCGEVAHLSAALEVAGRLRPDVCLLDASLAHDLAEAIERLLDHTPGTNVLVVAPALGEQDFLEAIRSGACGYVAAGAAPASIARALGDVLSGGTAVPRGLVSSLVGELIAGEPGDGDGGERAG